MHGTGRCQSQDTFDQCGDNKQLLSADAKPPVAEEQMPELIEHHNKVGTHHSDPGAQNS
ncbi:hypothetical protein D3C80_1418600 [compost metagenome]